ncbi:MAG: hypothetical protein PHU88_06120, partial [candidate division Zixibacteria bacterium]|nr:hypothetical protein [candidate division Zixibacteria bacterium]
EEFEDEVPYGERKITTGNPTDKPDEYESAPDDDLRKETVPDTDERSENSGVIVDMGSTGSSD